MNWNLMIEASHTSGALLYSRISPKIHLQNFFWSTYFFLPYYHIKKLKDDLTLNRIRLRKTIVCLNNMKGSFDHGMAHWSVLLQWGRVLCHFGQPLAKENKVSLKYYNHIFTDDGCFHSTNVTDASNTGLILSN